MGGVGLGRVGGLVVWGWVSNQCPMMFLLARAGEAGENVAHGCSPWKLKRRSVEIYKNSEMMMT